MGAVTSEAARVEIWHQRLAQIADAMGVVLRRTAVSPNIRERADFSCALFDSNGRLVAQAPHVPVHLGSMEHAVRAVIDAVSLFPDLVGIVNDPFAGGTHLPDLTLVEGVWLHEGDELVRVGYVACRAHHADVGGASPGSMPVGTSAAPGNVPQKAQLPPAVGPRYDEQAPQHVFHRGLTIADEGVRISPMLLDDSVVERVSSASRLPAERRADLAAQRAALAHGRDALRGVAAQEGRLGLRQGFELLSAYGERLMRATLAAIPDGIYPFADSLDDDGAGRTDIGLRVVITIDGETARVDLEECDDETSGSLNAVRAVTEAAVAYVFRLLLPDGAPTCGALLAPIAIETTSGSICDAQPPRAVSAGNVETSQRLVDLLLGALHLACPGRIPAASAGTMSNLLLGDDSSAYYETIGGGAGGGPTRAGASAVQTHMTNTRNTPVETLEAIVPARVVTYAVRRSSGGGGTQAGGDGIVRELELLASLTVTLIGERRRRPPYGLSGGGPGRVGEDTLVRDGESYALPAKIVFESRLGDRLRIETPGGGGFGDVRRAKVWAAVLSGQALTLKDLGG